ncbi:MAG TPA: DNA/RNA non-specific endonuclease [Rhizomicrobium sp.]|nr:DNA/RNA non-specific endonuclease [Rhizomicrobium sp.]
MRTLRIAALALAIAGGMGAAAPPQAPDRGSFAACEQRYAVTGLPSMKSDGSENGPIAVCHTGYALAYNPETRTPDWVIEHLPLDWLSGKANRKNNFHDDTAPVVGPDGPHSKDYNSTNFDRGHQAPAGDFKSSQPMTDESFNMTNMAPQVGVGFNRNIWKDLETRVRAWLLCGGRSELYIVTGPIFGDEQKWIPSGKKRVRVPEAFFKVIYDPTNKRALGMLLPNQKLDSADLPSYAVPISEIEERTGIVFFTKMTKRTQAVLKKSAGTLWGVDSSCDKDVDD